ncbi:hypothetical protein JHD50_10910 [Sulfurimonas sp. MAG313]|nr:hypothetical protein [Sulfurimonas sp. MAG313]MDF1881802.1 hypothetical protein [Sulfurimonas sp. MAG313]
MKLHILISSCVVLLSSLQASELKNLSIQEKRVYTSAQIEGEHARKAKSLYLNTKEKCNVAYGHLSLNIAQESHIDTYIKGFFEACIHPHS